jgi:TatD DNase family protein
VLHSFAGDEVTARQALGLGFWLGITGPVTFRNALELQRLVAALPLERLLVETDSPFLTPHPQRGRRNEPALVRLVAEKIAELQVQPLKTVSEFTTASAERLFSWRESV